MSWLYYDRDHMDWSADFEPLDTTSRPMDKGDFLNRLTTGNYLPLKIKTNDSSLCYQLYRMDGSVDKGIKDAIRNEAQVKLQYHQMEGQPLPGFDFVDLNNTTYNATATKGKIVVLNCWFIHCQACKEEMPELNKIVQQASKLKDVVFVSLAFDKADSLRKFLTTTKFDYAVVPDKENYLMNVLRIVGYPTHIIVNREGKIVKVIDGNFNEFVRALNRELRKEVKG